MVVVFPEPLGPSSPKISFFFILNEIPFTASFDPYFFLIFLTSTKFSIKI